MLIEIVPTDNIGEANITLAIGVGEIPKNRESANTAIFVGSQSNIHGE
ncbi:hypothetical protein [Planktothrix sp. FACHB-1365]|nr:hypothetical protein [Planktothrix sp. FACHB-1365]MBD2480923.1 hypothetical protein [Planktothrix sp. FACHB-1365]